MKSQTIRLIDVFVLGPFMIWAGTQLGNRTAGNLMIAAGALTILYNGRNYLDVKAGLDYQPHIHTADCPEGYPVEPGRCIK